MSKNLILLPIFLLLAVGHFAVAQERCEKINFDRPTVTELETCGFHLFVTKSYDNSRVIPPYKSGNKYYLSNNDSGTTCGVTKNTFRLDQGSFVKIAYFLYYSSGASLTVIVSDLGSPIGGVEWQMEVEKDPSKSRWMVFEGYMDHEIAQAKVEIRTEMVMESTMAVQYLNILNSDDGSSLCRDDDPITTEQPSTTTEEVTSTTEEPTTTEEVTSTTEEPTTTTQEETSTTEEPSTTEEVTSTTEEPSTTEEVTSTTEEPATTTQEVTSEPTTESSTETTESSSSSTEIPTTTDEPPTITDEPPTESPPVIHRTRDILLILLMCIIVAAIILVIIFIIRNFFCVAEVGAYEIQRDESPIPRLRVDKDTSLGPIVTDANKPGINSLDQVQWKMEMMKQYDGKK